MPSVWKVMLQLFLKVMREKEKKKKQNRRALKCVSGGGQKVMIRNRIANDYYVLNE